MINIKKYLKLLKCPQDGSSFKLIINKKSGRKILIGKIISKKNNNVYKIENNIIKFVASNNYAKSFEYQFKKFKKILFDGKAVEMPDHTNLMFKKIINNSNLHGKIIIDIGCGGGRFVNEALKQNPKLIIALDYSGAIEQLQRNLGNKVEKLLLIQADALNIPIKDNVLDFAYSIGALHHTSNVKKGFKEICRIVKPKSKIAISVYRKGYYCNLCVTIMRKFLNLFNEKTKFKLAYIYSNIIYSIIPNKIKKISILRKIIPYVYLPNKQWSIYDTIDSITPVYQACFSKEEVKNLFIRNRLTNIIHLDWGVSHIGEKK